ncbi:MAG: hypothetical protein ABEI77_09680, partial [Halorientalis sp.]
MSADGEKRRVHFLGPDRVIEKADALADVLDKDRTDIIVEALQEYIAEKTSDEQFERMVADLYYEDRLDFETVATLVGRDTAQRFRLLKRDLVDEPLDIPAPNTEVDVYDGETQTVDTDGS